MLLELYPKREKMNLARYVSLGAPFSGEFAIMKCARLTNLVDRNNESEYRKGIQAFHLTVIARALFAEYDVDGK